MASTKVFGPTPAELERTVELPAAIYGARGMEARQLRWWTPRFRFTAVWPKLDDTDVRSIMNFFYEHDGNVGAFLLQDPTAPNASGQSIGIGDAQTVAFKIYGDRAASISAYVNGGAVTYTTSLDNGLITFAAAPASGTIITADVTSERFEVRFLEPMHDSDYFIAALVRTHRVAMIQTKHRR